MSLHRTYGILCLTLIAAFLSARPLFAQAGKAGEPKPKEQIDVNADTLSVKDRGNEVEGQGNVEIRRQEMILRADQVWLNRETQEMEAAGNVTVDDPEWKIKQADRMRFNLGAEVGTIENGEIFLEKGHLSLSGSRLQKLPGQAYHIDDGIFTTCLCDSGPPTWKIAAKELDVTREGDGRIRGGVFYILDVPVFYFPYAIFPVRTERQTGFLFPEFGTSGRRGFWFMQPFYWAINKSSDATLTLDVETKARVGGILQYRSIFSKDFSAQIDGSFFKESLRDNANGAIRDKNIAGCTPGDGCHVIPEDRWSFVSTHRQTNLFGWTTYSDAALFSDDFFVRELARNLHFNYEQERDIKTSRYSQSRLGFLRSWGDATLNGEWNYYQDFIQTDTRTLQRTPQVVFAGRQVLWNTPLELRWRAAGVNYLRLQGADGLRFDFRPELLLPFNFGNYVHGSLSAAPRETLYHLFEDRTRVPFGKNCSPCEKDRAIKSFSRNNSRELVEVNGKVGTTFGRVFAWDGAALQKIKHVVEPEVGYVFISRSNQSDIPIMDGVDRVNHRNVMTFSVTNRFWGKFAQRAPAPQEPDVEMVAPPTGGDTRELAQLKVALNYGMESGRTEGDRLSDLDIGLRLMPKDFMAFSGGGGIDTGRGRVSQAFALFSIFDPRPITRRVLDQDFMRPNSLDLSYRFIGRSAESPLAENANLVLVKPSASPTKDCTGSDLFFDARCRGANALGLINLRSLYHLTDHLLLMYDMNYNVLRSRFATNRGAIKILSQCECWTLTLALNHSTNPNETSFRFNFDLLGLSSQSKPSLR